MPLHAFDLVGQRFGRLTVIEQAPRVAPTNRISRWFCRCDCGGSAVVQRNNLITARTVSCGCHNEARRTTHGMTRTRTYRSWVTMWQRCTNPNDPRADRYLGRGIEVCERWQSFENFLADMGERPPGTTIDRFPDNNGNYEPGNCRWATPAAQTRNQAQTKLSPDLVQEIHGRCEHGESALAVARRFGVTRTHVYRIRQGLVWRDQADGPS
jgi:hypothetical protein